MHTLGKVAVFFIFWAQLIPILAEPSCTWNQRRCPTLKCVEVTEDFLKSTLKSKVMVLTSVNMIPCIYMEITHSNVSNVSKEILDVKFSEKYEQIKLSGINLKNVDKNTFEFFNGVKRIYLDHNVIDSVTLGDLHQLEDLDLSWNDLEQLTSTNVPQLPTLLDLNLRFNKLSLLDLCNFSNLSRLDVGHNNLSAIGDEFQCNEMLTNLRLSFNRITTIKADAFRNLVFLEVLSLNDNLITVLENRLFVTLKNLRELNLQNNNISSINSTFSQDWICTIALLMKSKIWLLMDCQLKTLDLRNNSFYLLPKMFQSLRGLQSLFLKKPKGFDEQVLAFEPFIGLETLSDLDLSHFGITFLSVGSFTGLDNLQNLNLSYNNLTELVSEVFIGMPNLESLDLHNNSITKIAENSFYDLINLKILNLHYNKIRILEKNAFKGLRNLNHLSLHDLYVEEIQSGAFDELYNCRHLTLFNNLIREINENAFIGLPELRFLNLEKNQISSINPDQSGLGTVDLSSNSIKEIVPKTFASLTKVSKFYINHNSVPVLKKDAFFGLRSLLSLDLSNMNIEQIEPGAFDSTLLETLDLRRNKIKKIQKGVFDNMPYMLYLYLNSQLTELTTNAFDGLHHTPVLHINRGNFSEIVTDTFKGVKDLVVLSISNTRIGAIRSNGLKSDPVRYILLLKNTTIEHFDAQSIPPLKYLEILHNYNGSLESEEQNYFNFSKLSIKSIAPRAFILAPNNEIYHSAVVNFDYNQISVIKADTFNVDFDELSLEHNVINTIEAGAFTSLVSVTRLSVAYNDLKAISNNTFLKMINLKFLDLGHNNITRLYAGSFSGLNSLTKLDISFNKLKMLPSFDALTTQLKTLNLEYNAIDVFDKCPSKVQDLNLRGNSLTNLNLKVACPDIKTVDFRENNIFCNSLPSLHASCEIIKCVRHNIVPGVHHSAGLNCIADKTTTKTNSNDLLPYLHQLINTEHRYKENLQKNKELQEEIQNAREFIENMTNAKLISEFNKSMHVKKHHGQATNRLGVFEILLVIVCVLVCTRQLIKLFIYGVGYSKRRIRSESSL
ncbi:hypothetical protein FQR65_LT04860 [Abscondita terminalis]|nr:hypothetical protein FQR65_LT04860 [Abscondita terminalis]